MNNNFKNRIVFSKYKKYFEDEKYNLNELISLATKKPEKFEEIINYICSNINRFNYEETKKAILYMIKTDNFNIYTFINADIEHQNMILDVFDNKNNYNYNAIFEIYNYVICDSAMRELYLDKIVQISLKYTNNIECLLKFAKKTFANEKMITMYTEKIEKLLNESFSSDTKKIDISLFKRIVRFYSVYMSKRKTNLEKIYIKAIPFYINDGISNSNFSSLLSLLKNISNMEILFNKESKDNNINFINEVRKTIIKTKNKNYIALYIYQNEDYELLLQIFDSYEKFLNYCFLNHKKLGIDIEELHTMFNKYINYNHFSYVDDRIRDYLNKPQNKKVLK